MTRKVEFDIMKGIGIILMIVGHWMFIPTRLYQVIYSFHMPMFFILSGYFYNFDNSHSFSVILKKESQRILLPYAFTAIVCVLCFVIRGKWQRAVYNIAAFGLGSMGINLGYGETYVGAIWFLIALFWSKIIYFLLSQYTKHPTIISIFLSLCISFWSNAIHYIPFGIAQGLCALGFIGIGNWLRYNKPHYLMIIASIICWIIAVLLGEMDIAICKFNCFPLNFVGACGGTFVLLYISKVISKIDKYIGLHTIGSHTLTILCVYTISVYAYLGNSVYDLFSFNGFDMSEIWLSTIMMIIVIIVSLLITKIPYLNKIYP